MTMHENLLDINYSLDSPDPRMLKIIMSLYKQFGQDSIGPYDIDANVKVITKSLAKAWVLQNAYDRGLTVNELLRNVIDARGLIEENTYYGDFILNG